MAHKQIDDMRYRVLITKDPIEYMLAPIGATYLDANNVHRVVGPGQNVVIRKNAMEFECADFEYGAESDTYAFQTYWGVRMVHVAPGMIVDIEDLPEKNTVVNDGQSQRSL